MQKRDLKYDPTAPFPPVGSPGEFGRAWLDSLYQSAPPTYATLLRNGTLRSVVDQKESEGQELYQSLLDSSSRTPAPSTQNPLATLGQQERQAREIAMAQLREEFEPTREEESEENEERPNRARSLLASLNVPHRGQIDTE